MSRTTPLTVALVLVSAAALAAQAKPDFAELYRQAITHVERREYGPAEQKLLQAMKLNPESGRDVIRRGMFQGREDYFPEYFLGVVYTNTNRPALALTQFQIARKRGLNPRESRFRQIDEFEKAATALAAAEASKAKPVPTVDASAQFKNLMEQAQKALGDNRFDDAESYVNQAKGLNVDNSAADAFLATLGPRRLSARLQQQLKGSLSLPELRKLLGEYENAGVNVDEVRRRIDAALAFEARATAERNGMVEFFSGNYQKALTLIAEAEKAAPLTPRGHFYRACSLASLATRGKAINQNLLRDARRAYAAATAQKTDAFKEDLRYISPRLLQLLQAS